ncbi:transcriptional regulator, AraC family [bacterium A37T11]|nr:transcriptional regulator, AraC family [bacterium A37T11]
MDTLPVFDINGLDVSKDDVFVKPFATYLKEHQQLWVPHGHSFYHVLYLTEGGGYQTIDFDRFEVKPFQISFMIPGQIHHWDFSEKVDGYVFNFSESFFQSFLLRPDYLEDFTFFKGVATDSVIEVPSMLQSRIKGILEEMMGLRQAISPINLDRLRVLGLDLFFRIAALQTPSASSNGHSTYNMSVIKNFQKLIEKQYTSLKLPSEYAALLHMTPNHLNAICTEVLGISAGEVIRNRIVLEAKRRLVNLELPISTIAYQLNFNDNSYFTKFFKKHTGQTPEIFRREQV